MTLPKIVTHPLGLAGYAMALVFGLVAKFCPENQLPWLLPVAVTMALICAMGGLLLANRQINAKTSVPHLPGTAGSQTSSGDQSPNIANTTGSVHIEYGSRTRPHAERDSRDG